MVSTKATPAKLSGDGGGRLDRGQLIEVEDRA